MKSTIKTKIFIGFSIIVITLMLYLTMYSRGGLHDFYRRLYYIPIILAAFKFRLKGAIISFSIIILLYVPHLLLYFRVTETNIVNQVLEIIMFMVVACITGTLVEKEFKVKKLLEDQVAKITSLENYTKNILDSILNGVIAVDKNLKITSINKEGKKTLDYQDNYDKYIYEFFEGKEVVKILLKDALDFNKNIIGYETYSIGKNGAKVPVRIHSYVLKNLLDVSQGMVLIIEDVSQVRKLEEHIRRTEKLSAIGELASGIAHEIRNPLGIIKTIAQTISKDVEDEETKEGLEIIEHEIDRANKVIQGLLDFARPSIFKNTVKYLNETIDTVIMIINKYAQQHKVNISFNYENNVTSSIDEDKLKQAFINIIFNSVQAMPRGGNIYINLYRKEQWNIISFKDEGVGINKSKLEKVFEPFYSTKEKGTGLGLSITHSIIEEHKGYIQIESKEGKGTQVDIYLPFLKLE